MHIQSLLKLLQHNFFVERGSKPRCALSPWERHFPAQTQDGTRAGDQELGLQLDTSQQQLPEKSQNY